MVGETRDIEQREAPQHDEDARELAELGYESRFSRGMSLWANFSVGFTYLSPVVGIYALFAFAVLSAGPPAVWSLVIAGAGQFLVALVFAEVVSQYPIAGGVYPWARRLSGKRWAWLTGWIYCLGAADHGRVRCLRCRSICRVPPRYRRDKVVCNHLCPDSYCRWRSDQHDRHKKPVAGGADWFYH